MDKQSMRICLAERLAAPMSDDSIYHRAKGLGAGPTVLAYIMFHEERKPDSWRCYWHRSDVQRHASERRFRSGDVHVIIKRENTADARVWDDRTPGPGVFWRIEVRAPGKRGRFRLPAKPKDKPRDVARNLLRELVAPIALEPGSLADHVWMACESTNERNPRPYLSDDKVDAYAFPGGYPLLYHSDEGGTVCPDCAPRNGLTSANAFAFYEGSPEFCDDCGKETEAAYGDPDSEDEEPEDEDNEEPDGPL